MKIPPPTVTFIGLALAFLTVKDLQEVAGIRVVSLVIPTLLAALHAERLRDLVVPRLVATYMIFGCVILPLISIVNQGAITVYDVYLPMTILSAYALVGICYSTLGKDLEWLINMYVAAMIVMCVLSYATFSHQWFGSYTIRSFSDFSTFFALQVSLAVPFLHGKYRNSLRVFVLITLFFTYSRLSFFLSLAVVLFQIFKENKIRFLLLVPIFSLVFTGFLLTTTAGNLMISKMTRLVSIGSMSSIGSTPDPSDLGRIAYLLTTLDNLNGARVIVAGHGIKTNHEIIGKNIDVAAWGLEPGMADATVHNVYVELLSDAGLVGLIPFVICICYVGYVIGKYHGIQSNYFIAFMMFCLSYMFEANYVSFFFEFAVMYFLFVAYDVKRRAIHRAGREVSVAGLFRWFASAHIGAAEYRTR